MSAPQVQSLNEDVPPMLALVYADGTIVTDDPSSPNRSPLFDYLLAGQYGGHSPEDTLALIYTPVVTQAAKHDGNPSGVNLLPCALVHLGTHDLGNEWLEVEYGVLRPGLPADDDWEESDLIRRYGLRIDGRA
jgi:hypothetical protein